MCRFKFLFSLLVVLLLQCWSAASEEHAPDEAPIIKRKVGWCENGSQTSTTGECICSTHLGFHCTLKDPSSAQPQAQGQVDISQSCQFGYGISFFHSSCTNCFCGVDKEWIERREAFRTNLKESPKSKKGPKRAPLKAVEQPNDRK